MEERKEVNAMAKRQKSNRNREESYAQRRQKLTEIQYEHLVERHVIRPSNSHYRVLDESPIKQTMSTTRPCTESARHCSTEDG